MPVCRVTLKATIWFVFRIAKRHSSYSGSTVHTEPNTRPYEVGPMGLRRSPRRSSGSFDAKKNDSDSDSDSDSLPTNPEITGCSSSSRKNLWRLHRKAEGISVMSSAFLAMMEDPEKETTSTPLPQHGSVFGTTPELVLTTSMLRSSTSVINRIQELVFSGRCDVDTSESQFHDPASVPRMEVLLKRIEKGLSEISSKCCTQSSSQDRNEDEELLEFVHQYQILLITQKKILVDLVLLKPGLCKPAAALIKEIGALSACNQSVFESTMHRLRKDSKVL